MVFESHIVYTKLFVISDRLLPQLLRLSVSGVCGDRHSWPAVEQSSLTIKFIRTNLCENSTITIIGKFNA